MTGARHDGLREVLLEPLRGLEVGVLDHVRGVHAAAEARVEPDLYHGAEARPMLREQPGEEGFPPPRVALEKDLRLWLIPLHCQRVSARPWRKSSGYLWDAAKALQFARRNVSRSQTHAVPVPRNGPVLGGPALA
jgi:hypothetical protein